ASSFESWAMTGCDQNNSPTNSHSNDDPTPPLSLWERAGPTLFASVPRAARLCRFFPQDVGWVERSEAHHTASRWASHGSTHPTLDSPSRVRGRTSVSSVEPGRRGRACPSL